MIYRISSVDPTFCLQDASEYVDGDDTVNETTMLSIRARDGDVTALNEVITRCRSFVYAICLSEVRQVTVAEELTQDVFVTMYRRFSTLQDPEKFLPWLRTIAQNTCRMWRRRHAQQVVSLEMVPDQHDPGSTRTYQRAELKEIIDTVFAQVSANSREVLLLRYLAECTEAEISAVLDLPVATVKSRLHEARVQGRRILKKLVQEILALQWSSDDMVRQVIERCGSPGCQCPETLIERR